MGLSAAAGQTPGSGTAGAGKSEGNGGIGGQPAEANTITIDRLPPTLKLGVRANFIQRQLGVVPTLVVVPDTASYAAAVGSWRIAETGSVRFPVLIDDGSPAALGRIMRFVRAFGPGSIVRWRAAGEEGLLPGDAAGLQLRLRGAVDRVWGCREGEKLADRWAAMKFSPPGVVCADTADAAWTGALALAAGRGQPLLFVARPAFGDVNSYLGLDAVGAFETALVKAVEETGYPYKELGDVIDAVTLCYSTPSKVFLGDADQRKMLALTDMVGRQGSGGGERPARWAWCGQVGGDASAAAYSAMCALFLQPTAAWLFNGYDHSEPWAQFDSTRAAAELEKIGLKTVVDDRATGAGLEDFRRRTAGASGAGFGVDAGFIAVNTSGNADFFDLKPGQGRPGDLPILRRPAMVYFVHSWSATSPWQPGTIARTWADRGAYAYVGSVHEPYLQGFVPTPVFCARLAAGMPWGVAARFDNGPAWKIAVFGDPLITVGPEPRRVQAALQIKGAEDVGESVVGMLKQKKFDEAMRALAMVGRDRDAARLVLALAKDDPDALTTQGSITGAMCAFAAGDMDALIAAARALLPAVAGKAPLSPAESAGIDEVRDMVWQATWGGRGEIGEREVALLEAFVRPQTYVRDVTELMAMADRVRGPGAGRDVLARAKLNVKDRASADALEKLGR